MYVRFGGGLRSRLLLRSRTQQGTDSHRVCVDQISHSVPRGQQGQTDAEFKGQGQQVSHDQGQGQGQVKFKVKIRSIVNVEITKFS